MNKGIYYALIAIYSGIGYLAGSFFPPSFISEAINPPTYSLESEVDPIPTRVPTLIPWPTVTPTPIRRVVSDCGDKYYCDDMDSCEEAYHYMDDCGLSRLDGDSDGIPCESLCGN